MIDGDEGVADRRHGFVGVDARDRAARRGFARFEHADVPAGARAGRHAGGHIVAAGEHGELEARRARLADFEQHLAPLEAIADAYGVFVGAFDGEIFAEGGGLALELRFGFPPWPVVGGVDVDRLVGAAVDGEIGLAVAVDIGLPDDDRRSRQRGLFDAADDLFVLPDAEG